MRELQRMGFTVGNFGTGAAWFYEEGGFDISAEDDVKGDPIQFWISYYGQDAYLDHWGNSYGGDPYIHPELEKMADEYGYYFEWYNAGILSAAPNY